MQCFFLNILLYLLYIAVINFNFLFLNIIYKNYINKKKEGNLFCGKKRKKKKY